MRKNCTNQYKILNIDTFSAGGGGGGTRFYGQNAFMDIWAFLIEKEAFGKRRFSQKTADFRRKPQKTAGTRRKPQIGVCPLMFVP